ncbi:primase-helicase zinc-binding domain-containing protein [Orbaceae bacterium ESL0727]|nr:primase-helicase zinc-binding domain-containing protein [Orbaceae bacterium ESL0727]
MNIKNIVTQLNGQWLTVFHKLGLDIKTNQHCPCPLCGGKDRFRMDDIDGRGTWICNQCGAGDGLELVKRYHHCSSREAAETAVAYAGIYLGQNNINHSKDTQVQNREIGDFEDAIKKDSADFAGTIKKENQVIQLLSKTTLGQSDYLTRKGLTYALPLLDNGRIFVPVIDIHGNYTGGQFIDVDGEKRLLKGTHKKGAFIAIGENKDFKGTIKKGENADFADTIKKEVTERDVIICEGVATAITLSLIKPDALILAAIDAGNLIHVARNIKTLNSNVHIIIAGDNDAHLKPNCGKEKSIKAAQAVKGQYTIPDTDKKCD